MAAKTAMPSALEQATMLDAVALFLGYLAELPAFMEKRDPLDDLVVAVGTARDELVVTHAVAAHAVEDASYDWLVSRGLLDGRGEFAIDPGSGRDVQFLGEKLHALASVVGAEWNFSERKWEL
jgi:hypothetical protein